MISSAETLLDFLNNNAELKTLRKSFILKRYLHPIKQTADKHTDLLFFNHSAEYAVVVGKEKDLLDLLADIGLPYEAEKIGGIAGYLRYLKKLLKK